MKGENFINIINEDKYSNYGSHLTSIHSICANIKFMGVDLTPACQIPIPGGFRSPILYGCTKPVTTIFISIHTVNWRTGT